MGGQSDSKLAHRILTDCLALAVWSGELIGVSDGVLFGVHSVTAQNLLDENRSEKQRSVDQRIAAAQGRMMRLRNSVGDDLFHEMVSQKVAITFDVLPRLLRYEAVGTWRECPTCHQNGAVLGDLELEPDVEIEYTRDGPVTYGGYEYILVRDSFFCNVCSLALNDAEELRLVGLPHERFTLSSDEITDELVEYAEAQNEYYRQIDEESVDPRDLI